MLSVAKFVDLPSTHPLYLEDLSETALLAGIEVGELESASFGEDFSLGTDGSIDAGTFFGVLDSVSAPVEWEKSFPGVEAWELETVLVPREESNGQIEEILDWLVKTYPPPDLLVSKDEADVAE